MNRLPRRLAADVRDAANHACSVWPNAHLGANTRREDLRSAFRFLRVRLRQGADLLVAVGALKSDCYAHEDM